MVRYLEGLSIHYSDGPYSDLTFHLHVAVESNVQMGLMYNCKIMNEYRKLIWTTCTCITQE